MKFFTKIMDKDVVVTVSGVPADVSSFNFKLHSYTGEHLKRLEAAMDSKDVNDLYEEFHYASIAESHGITY